MWKKIYLIALGVLTVVNLTALGYLLNRKMAEAPPPPPREERTNRFRLMDGKLTKEQREKFREAQRAFRARTDSLHRSIRQLQSQLLEAMLDIEPDSARISDILQELGNAHEQMNLHLVRHLIYMKQFLTPEQQRKLFQLMLSRMGGPPPQSRQMQKIHPNFRRR